MIESVAQGLYPAGYSLIQWLIQAIFLAMFLYVVLEVFRIRKAISRIETKIDDLTKRERKEETKIY